MFLKLLEAFKTMLARLKDNFVVTQLKMAPTICSGKKRQARADMRLNQRRPQPNVDSSIMANLSDSDMHTPPTSIHLNGLRHLHEIIGGEGVNNANYRQLLVDMSDNAVTSTTHMSGNESSDAADCRLGRRDNNNMSNDSSYYTNFSSNQNRDASSQQLGEKRKRPHYYSDDDETDEHSNNNNSMESTIYNAREQSAGDSTRGMDSDSASMASSFDVEKSKRLKRGNQPLLTDKLLATKQHNSVKCMTNTEGLLSIAIKTIKLVKRNQMLQQRLTQLQLETSDFIQSVLANPENSHFRAKVQQNVREVENV